MLYSDGKLRYEWCTCCACEFDFRLDRLPYRYFKKHPGGSGVPEVGTQAGTIDVTRVTEMSKVGTSFVAVISMHQADKPVIMLA